MGSGLMAQPQHRLMQTSKHLVDASMVSDGTDIIVAATSQNNKSCGATNCESGAKTDIVVTKRDKDGKTIWSKIFDFTDVDHAVHIAKDGNNFVILGTTQHAVSPATRPYEINAVVFTINSTGQLLNAKTIHYPFYPGHFVDLIGTHITPDNSGGYIMTGFLTNDFDPCFNSPLIIRYSLVCRLDASLNITWKRLMHYTAVTPGHHRYVSGNYALMSPNGSSVYITGQGRSGGRAVAYVASIDAATGNLNWHKGYRISSSGNFEYYGIKLLNDPNGKLAWLLRPELGGGNGHFALGLVEPMSGAILSLQEHHSEEMIVADMEFSDDVTLAVSSLGSFDNQILVGINWPANTGKWSTFYLANDANLIVQQNECNVPYFEADNFSIAICHPFNLEVNGDRDLIVVNAGTPASNFETLQLSKFNNDGELGGISSGGIATPAVCKGYRYNLSASSLSSTDIGDELEYYDDFDLILNTTTAGATTSILKDDCNSGSFSGDVINSTTDVSVSVEMQVFPNPVYGVLNLKVPDNSGAVGYSLMAADGVTKLHGMLMDEQVAKINTEDLSSGIYMLIWNNDEGDFGATQVVIE